MAAAGAARPLLALAVAVLAVHLLLLRAAPGRIQAADPFAGRTLIMRTITLAPRDSAVQFMPAAAPPARARNAAAPLPDAMGPPPVPAVTTAPAAAAPDALLATAAQPLPSHPTSSPQMAFTVPGSQRLHYQVEAQVRNQAWRGSSELHWRHDGRDYEARLEVSVPLLPTRVQRSTGQITGEGLAPLRFSDKSRSEQAAHFDREQGKVNFSSNRPDAQLLAGTQDRLSVLLQLSAMVAGDPSKFEPGTTIAIPTAGTRDAEPWLFAVENEEALQLPGGTVQALKLTRHPRKEFDQKVELWLAPAMDYVPVRLRLTQPNGDWADQQWSSTDRG